MFTKHIPTTLFVLSVTIFILFVPRDIAHAEARYESKTFSKSVILRRSSQPYYFSGNSIIPKGVTVTVEKGTHVFMEGNILIRGRLAFQGEKDSPVSISCLSRDSSAYTSHTESFTVAGGELVMSDVDIRGMPELIQAYASSTVLMDSVRAEDVGSVGGASMVSIFDGSLLSVKNSVFDNVISEVGFQVFKGSTASIENSSFFGVGVSDSILAYDGQNSDANSLTTLSAISVAESHFKGRSDRTASSTAGRASSKQAIEIFGGTYGQVSASTFEGFGVTGLLAFAQASVEITGSIFAKNNTGITAYSTSYVKMHQNEISENAERGALSYGGSIDASSNWWGSETGPYNADANSAGRGNKYEGAVGASPWLSEKPKKKSACCSSVLFIPGMEGSRIYKNGAVSENQLWEPNRNTDVSKLYLAKDGNSIDKSLYFRDIISRTNILFGGNDDMEIYRGLIKSLNRLNFNYSIEDWQFAAYDWRMSPNTIVTEGTRYKTDGDSSLIGSGSIGQYKKMEDQVIIMAETSKTGKVTLLAHSYGGLVSKRFLAYLVQKGKIGLIDKVIFVAVPENGSPSSLFALLHGDNQDIGGGFIVSKSTMRKLAQNMPAAYALLPKTDSDLIRGIQAADTISAAVPGVGSVQDMYNFLFKEIARPSAGSEAELNVPAVGNKKIKETIDIESGPNFIKQQSDPAYKNIEFYNILGAGVDTVKSIQYVKRVCDSSYTMFSFLLSPNCGLDHVPVYSSLGDGVVLADDVLESSMVPTAQNSRWGEKYIFNLAEYNRKSGNNYSHSNLISSAPIISTLMQIMLNNVGSYALPQYVTRHGGVRMGGEAGQPEGGNGADNDAGSAHDIYRGAGKKYQISASDAVLIYGKDLLGNVIGANFSLIGDAPDIIPIQNSFPNSSVSHMGDSYYVRSETLPSTIYLRPDQGAFASRPNSSSDSNFGISRLDFKISESGGENLAGTSTGSSASNAAEIASFENIPITEYSTIEVHVGSQAGSSGSSGGSTSSSTSATSSQVTMTVTDQYDGVYSTTTTYVSPQSLEPDETADIPYLIALIRGEIQRSGVRANFKQRYLLKLNAIGKNYQLGLSVASSTAATSTQGSQGSVSPLSPAASAGMRLARKYAMDTSASLVAILKDLNRSRAFYYKGGMTKPEAAFLYSQFGKLSRAFARQQP